MNAYLAAKAKEFYELSAVSTASPVRLIVMLYDGCIKFLRMAELLYEEQNFEKARQMVAKAIKILLELMAALDLKRGGEIARNLLELYRFMLKESTEINQENYREKIGGLLRLLHGLQETWVEVEQKLSH